MNLCAAELVADGWMIEKAKKIRWAQQDFFALWDIIAIKNGVIRFIKVSAKPDYDKGKDWRKRASEFPHPSKEYWWRDGREWRIKSL